MHAVSIIIPVQNEAESLPVLMGELAPVLRKFAASSRVVIVDDGSTDSTWQVIETLVRQFDFLSAIRLKGNFGKSIALQAGINGSTAPIIVTMDGDLQDDPAEIPGLVSELDSGFSVVSGWKQRRQDPWMKRLMSRAFNVSVSLVSGVKLHDHNCGLKAYRREVFENIRLSHGLHRFVPVLAVRHGFKVRERVVHHRPRLHGHSHYGWGRMFEAFADLLGILWFGRGTPAKSATPSNEELIMSTMGMQRQDSVAG